jgi:hypothetical protein
MYTTPSASHVVVPGVKRHVIAVSNGAIVEAKPDVPVSVVNEIVAPGAMNLVCGVALGATGAETVGISVADAN